MKFCIALLACLAISFYSFAQTIPENPNVADAKGLRQGKWTLLFDANWKPVNDPQKAAYYRLIEYHDDIPSGITRDYFADGKVQYEGTLLKDRPADVYDGESSWYRKDGSKEMFKVFDKGKLVKETYFNLDGSEATERWTVLNEKARKLRNAGDFRGALELMHKARLQAEKEFGAKHANTGVSISNLALLYLDMGNYAQAEAYFLDSKKFFETMFGKENQIYAWAVSGLAIVYRQTGLYEKSEQWFLEAKAIREKTMGGAHPDYANSLSDMAQLYQEMGEYEKAESLFLQSKNIREKALGKEHDTYAQSLQELAGFYSKIGSYGKAELLYLEAGKILEKKIGKEHPNYARYLNNLAVLYNRMGLYKKAELMYLESKSIAEKKLGKDHPAYAISLNNLALIYRSMSRYADAEALLLEAKRIQEKVVGKDHSDYAFPVDALGNVYEDMGEFEKAEAMYLESRKIWEQRFGKEHPDYIFSQFILMRLYANMGLNDKSEAMFRESHEALIKQLSRSFSSMSESEKDLFYATVKKRFEVSNTLIFTSKLDKAVVLPEGYNLQLATKAMLFNSANKVRKRIMSSGDDSLKTLFSAWQRQRNALIKAYQMGIDERKAKNIDITLLEEDVNKIEKQLSLRSQLFSENSKNNRYAWQDVQKKLKKGEAAIELVRFRKYGVVGMVTDSSHAPYAKYVDYDLTDTVHYAALIITAESKIPEAVLLKNGNDLERRFLKNYKNSVQFKLSDTISYNQYWRPIAAVLDRNKIKQVYVSPDGIYNSINLNTLQNPETGVYLASELDIRLVTNTGDLITQKGKVKRGSTTQASLFGYPDYAGEAASDSERKRNVVMTMDTTQRFFTAGKIRQLPGTEVEIKSIREMLAVNKIQSSQYLDRQASEEEIKKLVNPGVLHIATHGFFLQDLSMTGQQAFAGFETKRVQQNPLLRSGLLLANSQRAIDGDRDPAREDGILTSYEAMNLNLDKTELVVLSACETGLGEIRNGEGVYGLQRAFQTAGAKSVLMSLWKVDDTATQELMTAFYKNWLKSGDKREAFKKAQETVRKKYSHPYYWGAFVLVGE